MVFGTVCPHRLRSSLARAPMICLVATAVALAHSQPSSFPCSSPASCAATPLWHIPGPNPIITPRRPASGAKGGWASTECEAAASIIESNGTYFFSYHCTGGSTSYQDAFSTAASPLGPWSLVSESPALALGGDRAWDSKVVASLNAVPDPSQPGHWLGFYEGGDCFSDDAPPGGWSMGLASAPHILGPWAKHAANPVLWGNATCNRSLELPSGACGGIYVNSVLQHDGQWWAYFDAPVNQNDEAPLTLWTSPAPEGPWTFKAVVADGTTQGQWDYGRYSGGSVIRQHSTGLFHVFLSASPTRANKEVENLGWATSGDGLAFTKHTCNPLASAALNASAPEVESGLRSRTTPWTTAMAEASVFIEEPFIYVSYLPGHRVF